MQRYPKIQTLFEREKGKGKQYVTNKIRNKDSIKALLQCRDLVFEEKVDGASTQIEISWDELGSEIINIERYKFNL